MSVSIYGCSCPKADKCEDDGCAACCYCNCMAPAPKVDGPTPGDVRAAGEGVDQPDKVLQAEDEAPASEADLVVGAAQAFGSSPMDVALGDTDD